MSEKNSKVMDDILFIKNQMARRRALKKELYHDWWASSARQARLASEAGQTRTRIRISAYRHGYPPFDVPPLVQWIARQFEKSGMRAQIQGTVVTVSWDHLSAKKVEASDEGPSLPPSSFESLANLRVIASKIKSVTKDKS